MLNLAGTRIRGVRRTPSSTLCLTVALLVILQLAVPVGVAFADPAPAPVSHLDHVGSQEDPGCPPAHDDAFCLSCRVLSPVPLGSRALPSLAVLPVDRSALLRSETTRLPDDATVATLRARAPPRL